MNDDAKPVGVESSTASPEAQPEDKPFACPHCGQMLAPTCRVCVACHGPVEAPVGPLAPVTVEPAETEGQAAPPPEPVRFPWGLMLLLFAASWITVMLAVPAMGFEKTQWVLGGVQIGCGAWVYYDARLKGIPKPLRWAAGTLLIWIMVFPWFLVRRRSPERPCPFIEREVSLVWRAVLLALLVFFLISAMIFLVKGPAK